MRYHPVVNTSNAARIQGAASNWLARRSLRFEDLQPPQFRQAITDVSRELAIPKGEVLEQLMALWTANNERGHAKEHVTGGPSYQGTSAFRSVSGSVVGARMQALTQRKPVDLGTVLTNAEVDAVEKPFQQMMRGQGEDMSGVELRRALHTMLPALLKLQAADRANEESALPPGTQWVPHGDVGGLVPEGVARKLAERFLQTGKPQAVRLGDTLMVVDGARPTREAALADWQRRDSDPENLAKTLGKAVRIANQCIRDRLVNRPERVDIGALLDRGELDAVEKPFQRMMRTQGEGMSAAELRRDIATMEGTLDKIRDASKTNELLECPPGTELMTQWPGEIPTALRGDIVPVEMRSVGGKTHEGVAKELVERFAASGVPQAIRVEDALLIVDEKRPDARSALADWQARNQQPRGLAADLTFALLTARARLADLG